MLRLLVEDSNAGFSDRWSNGLLVASYPPDCRNPAFTPSTSGWLVIRPDHVRHGDPCGRGFEYAPFSDQNLSGPINQLWG
jgi:hypothetical protein